MRELKLLGGKNSTNQQRKTFTGKQRFQDMIKHYEQYRWNYRLPATFEVIYGHAWKTEHHIQYADDQAISIPINKIKRATQKVNHE
jgi:malonyl-CoA O-methyltransferase